MKEKKQERVDKKLFLFKLVLYLSIYIISKMIDIKKMYEKLPEKSRNYLKAIWLSSLAIITLLSWNREYMHQWIKSSGWMTLTEMSHTNISKIKKIFDKRNTESSLKYWRNETIIDSGSDVYMQLHYHWIPWFSTGWARVLNKEQADLNKDWIIDNKELWWELDKILNSN